MFTIMVIKILPRDSAAPKVQEILTKNGCIIKTRLGLHEATGKSCEEAGLVILNLLNDSSDKIQSLLDELNNVEGVNAKILEI